ncbi:unnamed protein product [Gongylonema pulchrum]|uniref:FBD domain-containing protein n=1 Tax=Gongylonema pulchrum TaxID=637853 RepID=A0A183DMU5_9BILA|nr:unnamed protein product [Gongylonema pulchrum]
MELRVYDSSVGDDRDTTVSTVRLAFILHGPRIADEAAAGEDDDPCCRPHSPVDRQHTALNFSGRSTLQIRVVRWNVLERGEEDHLLPINILFSNAVLILLEGGMPPRRREKYSTLPKNQKRDAFCSERRPHPNM